MKSILSIGKLFQQIHRVLIQVFWCISNQIYSTGQLSQYIDNILVTRSKIIEKKVAL